MRALEKIILTGPREMSLLVVGIPYPNPDRSCRRKELAKCFMGEFVKLMLEPHNPVDPRAVAVLSARGVQLGYLTAERCGMVGSWLRAGAEYEAVFQEAQPNTAVIRARFGGGSVELPPERDDVIYDRQEMIYGEFIDWGC